MEILFDAVPPLMAWYRLSRRDLPWRRDKEPYHVWVSEIMLQQTRVEQAKDYYLRFLEKFPTAEALSTASEEEVLKAWEGLGYYTRAKNLHRASKIVAENGFPTTYEGIRKLPGVGDYTAGAISSIAFNLPCPAVDGNVLRILTRLLASYENIDLPETKKRFAELLREVYPEDASSFCQALMELGAIVCVPNGEPLCEACPWGNLCKARAQDVIDELPQRQEKRARKVENLNVYVMKCGEKYALEKRPSKGLLSGLYGFPTSASAWDVPEVKTKTAVHIFTHVEWRMTGHLVEVSEEKAGYAWATKEEIDEKYALPTAFKAFLPWIKGV